MALKLKHKLKPNQTIKPISTQIQTKLCTQCGIEKLATTEFFYLKAKSKDGLRAHCKICCSSYQKERYQNDPDWRQSVNESSLAYQKERYQNDPDWRQSENERNLAWAKDNPDKVNASSLARKAHKLEASPCHSSKPKSNEWAILEANKILAIYSEAADLDWKVDHIAPLKPKELPYQWVCDLKDNAKNFPDFQPAHDKFKVRFGLACGLHVSANLRPMPPSENSSKGNKFMTYRETPDAIYLLSKDGQSWVPITKAELANYSWIEPQLYQAP